MIKKITAYFSEAYQDQDFVTQQKVRVLTGICLSILFPAGILLLTQIVMEAPHVTIPMLITGAGAVVVLLILTGIRKGFFLQVAHVLPVTLLCAVWAVMIFENGGIVERLDTISIVIGCLSFTALIITRRPIGFLLYFGLSGAAFLLCTLYIQSKIGFSNDLFIEYVVDSLFGMVMLGVTSYLVFSINKKALDKATISIRRAEEEAEKNRELNKTLEIKVQERTQELKAAVDELEIINAHLIQAHDALWGEMQLAKKIQTVLLPNAPQIPCYEITAFMEPADDVGGDYYDIINFGGFDWIIIGDVSGHGIPAGLVMMMVQTAIHLSIKMSPDTSPSKLLVTVNSVISENIKKLGEDKYMTITVLACHKHGVLHFSGLHQDIMVYRKEKRQIEHILTTGMWIGVMDDIDGMITDDQLTLHAGDTMLLYTDGLSEARGREKNDIFGEGKLEQILLASGDRPTQEIKSDILAALDSYTCTDDVTFILLKKI